MKSTTSPHAWITSVLRGLGGILLVFSVTQPLAREGVGAATSMHALFDLLLGDTIRVGIPRWLGLFGYAPAIGGILVMLAEAARGRLRTSLRVVGLLMAGVALVAIAFGGPWHDVSRLGPAVWVGAAGFSLVVVGLVADSILAKRTRRQIEVNVTEAAAMVNEHPLDDPDPGAQARSTASYVL